MVLWCTVLAMSVLCWCEYRARERTNDDEEVEEVVHPWLQTHHVVQNTAEHHGEEDLHRHISEHLLTHYSTAQSITAQHNTTQ